LDRTGWNGSAAPLRIGGYAIVGSFQWHIPNRRETFFVNLKHAWRPDLPTIIKSNKAAARKKYVV
jgi:hypothetical protein